MSTAERIPASGPGTGRNPWAVFALLAVAQFVVVLDAGIVYVALPSIQRELGFSPSGLAWVMDAYMVMFGGFMLLAGRAADLVGRRRLLVIGLVLFAVASLACGVAAESWQLVAARAGQGLGAALVSPVAIALITDIFDEGPDRYKAMGMFAGVGGLAGASGVLIGGVLTAITWELAFLINVPIILVVLAIGLRVLPRTEPTAVGGVDVTGALAGTAGLCVLLYAVLSGGVSGWLDGATPAYFAAAVLLLGAFVMRQMRAAGPLIPRVILRLRNVVLGNVANAATGALMFGVFYVTSLFLQQVRGYAPLEAGLITAPISLTLFVVSQLTIRLFGRLSPLHALVAGLGVQGAALAWWGATAGPQTNIVTTFVLPGMLWGAGMGAAIVSAFVVCTSGLHGAVQGAASGLVSTTLQIGGAIGVAVLSTVAHGSQGAVPDPVAQSAAQGTALWAAAGLAAVAATIVLVSLRGAIRPPAHHGPGHDGPDAHGAGAPGPAATRADV